MLVRIATLLVLILSIVSCATNPVTGRSQFMIVSEKEAISASSEAYVKMLAPLDEKGKIDSDPSTGGAGEPYYRQAHCPGGNISTGNEKLEMACERHRRTGNSQRLLYGRR